MVEIRHRLVPVKGKEYRQIPALAITYKDVFYFEYLYYMIHEWLIENKYAGREDDHKFRETFYAYREGTSESIIRWRLTKDNPGPFKDKFFSFELDLDFHILGMKEVQLTPNNKKVTANTGEIEIKINGRVVIDKKLLGGQPFFEKLIRWWWKRPFDNKISAHEALLESEMKRLHDAIKIYFKLESYYEDPRFNAFFANATLENL